MGKDVTLTVHAGTGHAFMASHNALGTHDAEKADEIWPQAVAFLHDALVADGALSGPPPARGIWRGSVSPATIPRQKPPGQPGRQPAGGQAKRASARSSAPCASSHWSMSDAARSLASSCAATSSRTFSWSS